jgi:hypothetical protein
VSDEQQETTVNDGAFTQEDVQAMIDAALAKQQEQHERDLTNLRESISASAEPSTVTAHAGGIGTAIHDTWSLAEQELSRLGKHPDQKD